MMGNKMGKENRSIELNLQRTDNACCTRRGYTQEDMLTVCSFYHTHGKLIFNWRLEHLLHVHIAAQHLEYENVTLQFCFCYGQLETKAEITLKTQVQ